MKTSVLLTASLLLAASGAAFAGKAGTAGAAGSGSGGTISSDGSTAAAFGGSVFALLGNPEAYQRILGMPGSIDNRDGTVTSPPVTDPSSGKVLRVTVDRTGKIVRVEQV